MIINFSYIRNLPPVKVCFRGRISEVLTVLMLTHRRRTRHMTICMLISTNYDATLCDSPSVSDFLLNIHIC